MRSLTNEEDLIMDYATDFDILEQQGQYEDFDIFNK